VSLALYMDVHVPYPVTSALLARGVDVLTAQWDDTARWSDPALLDRAGALGRVLVSQDEDLLAEAARRQREQREFAGVIYAHQQSITIGRLIDDLEMMARVIEAREMANRVEFLPL
jgi:predicted nuclease of predicted toxin-antitoxin system